MVMSVCKKVSTNSTECITGRENVCRMVELAKAVEDCTVELVDQCKPVSKQHVWTVDKDVCEDELVDVLEEVCDQEEDNKVNVDSSEPPQAPVCRQVARKKVENVCRTLPKQVVEWREEDVCVKVPQNSCKTVSRTTPTKVIPVTRVSNGEGGWADLITFVTSALMLSSLV